MSDNKSSSFSVGFISQEKSKLIIHDTLHISFYRNRPGLFRRFWYWALLGWVWENTEK